MARKHTNERSPGDLVLSSSDTEDSLARLGWSHGSLLVKGLSRLEPGTSGMFPIHQCWRPDPAFYMAGRLGAESLGQPVEKWAQVGVYLDVDVIFHLIRRIWGTCHSSCEFLSLHLHSGQAEPGGPTGGRACSTSGSSGQDHPHHRQGLVQVQESPLLTPL